MHNSRQAFLIIGGIMLAALAGDAAIEAWGERRFVAAFAESLVAGLFYFVFPLGALAGGIYLGSLAARRSSLPWLGWVAGIAATLAGLALIHEIGTAIPGVDWRYERILNYEDY